MKLILITLVVVILCYCDSRSCSPNATVPEPESAALEFLVDSLLLENIFFDYLKELDFSVADERFENLQRQQFYVNAVICKATRIGFLWEDPVAQSHYNI